MRLGVVWGDSIGFGGLGRFEQIWVGLRIWRIWLDVELFGGVREGLEGLGEGAPANPLGALGAPGGLAGP